MPEDEAKVNAAIQKEEAIDKTMEETMEDN